MSTDDDDQADPGADGTARLLAAAARTVAAEQRATDAELRLLRVRIALDRHVPGELAGRLRGSTVREINDDADRLLAWLASCGGHLGLLDAQADGRARLN